MIRAVHCRAQQVGGAGVGTYEVLVGILVVYNRGNKITRGAGHVAAKLGEYARAHIRAAEHLVINLVYLFAHERYISGGFLGPIGYAYAAGKVDERYFHANFLVQFLCNGKEELCKRGIIRNASRPAP